MKLLAIAVVLVPLALHAQPDLVTRAPAVIAKCAPLYPEAARRAKIEGTVVLYVEIDPNGKARHFHVQHSLGLDLNEQAIQAVKNWRFSPGKMDGKLVSVPATIEVNFRLDDSSEPCRAGPPQVEPKPANGRV